MVEECAGDGATLSGDCTAHSGDALDSGATDGDAPEREALEREALRDGEALERERDTEGDACARAAANSARVAERRAEKRRPVKAMSSRRGEGREGAASAESGAAGSA